MPSALLTGNVKVRLVPALEGLQIQQEVRRHVEQGKYPQRDDSQVSEVFTTE